jgi:hypothetical protein
MLRASKGRPSSVYDIPNVSRSELATTHAMAPAATATRAFLVNGAPPRCNATQHVSCAREQKKDKIARGHAMQASNTAKRIWGVCAGAWLYLDVGHRAGNCAGVG